MWNCIPIVPLALKEYAFYNGILIMVLCTRIPLTVLLVALPLLFCLTGCASSAPAEKTPLTEQSPAISEPVRVVEEPAVFSAVKEGNELLVKEFLEAGNDPDPRDADGWTPLMYAAQSGERAIVQALIRAGADPAARNPNGEHALLLSYRAGHDAITDYLISSLNESIRTSEYHEFVESIWKKNVFLLFEYLAPEISVFYFREEQVGGESHYRVTERTYSNEEFIGAAEFDAVLAKTIRFICIEDSASFASLAAAQAPQEVLPCISITFFTAIPEFKGRDRCFLCFDSENKVNRLYFFEPVKGTAESDHSE